MSSSIRKHRRKNKIAVVRAPTQTQLDAISSISSFLSACPVQYVTWDDFQKIFGVKKIEEPTNV